MRQKRARNVEKPTAPFPKVLERTREKNEIAIDILIGICYNSKKNGGHNQ